MCTLCNICFVPLDRQTGRAVNINTDTESNDGCMDYTVKCQNALWKSKQFMQIKTQVDMVIMTHILNRKILKIKKQSSVLCILAVLLWQRELEKSENNSESRIMQSESLWSALTFCLLSYLTVFCVRWKPLTQSVITSSEEPNAHSYLMLFVWNINELNTPLLLPLEGHMVKQNRTAVDKKK